MSICPISDHVDLGHVVKVVTTRLVQGQVSVFPFTVNLILPCIQLPNHYVVHLK